MRFLLFLISILTVPHFVMGQALSEVKSDTLTDATALRPADLVIGNPSWSFSSVDMYTYHFSNGLYGNYGMQPSLMIDELPVDINFFGWQSLNMLPIYLPGVEGITTKSSPSTYQHTVHTAGVIDFQNSPVSPGLHAGGNVYLGNETGDPGPWVYDSTKVTPNVDRWGPDTGGQISFGKDSWYGRGTYVLRRHQQTDPLTHQRIHRTMRALGGTRFYPVQTNSQSGMLEGGYKSDRLTIRARGIVAEDRNYLFLQPFGREVPSETRYGQLAFDAKYNRESWNFGLRYIVNQKELTKRNPDHDYVFDWSQLGNLLKGSAAYSNNNYTLTGAISYDDLTTKAPGIRRINDAITGILVSFDLSAGGTSRYRFNAGLNVSRRQTAKTVSALYNHNEGEGWEMQLAATYSETLPIRQNSFGYWITRGYSFYRELGIQLDSPLNLGKNSLYHFNLQNTLELSERLSFSLNSELTHHTDLNIPWQEVDYDFGTGSTPGSFEITGEQGARFGFETSATYQTMDWLRQRLSTHFRTTLLGSRRYKNYFRQVPGVQISYRLDLAPVRNFAVSLQGRYRSSTRWIEFNALDGREYQDIDNLFPVFSGTYDSTLPSQVDLEIGALKWFWERRLSLQVTVQNLLNEEVGLHPIGADRALMFNIKATATF
ncbi:hypothetical protein G3570_13895 [Balneolaceae bacterium YR4-1]|uniref:TonB-dependent receptor n=1 Tax=Halalkalibaculum roseum TaxID=2709311 RepID=A0A6M1T709_9BACT|nr:hypothetical protein [Halalkalibaculum roseum]NGP77735.1 hypothetical protein [Halalkalibaculum roseum]